MKIVFKNISLLIFITFLFNFSINAQNEGLNAKMHWGQEYAEPPNTTATKIIGITGNGFYSLRQKVLQNSNARQKVYLEYFDRDMKLKKSVEQELKFKNKRRDFEDIIMIGGNLYLMTSYNNEAKKKNFLFKQKISSRSLLPSKNMDMVAATEAKNKEREGTFEFHISDDSSKLLIYNQLPYSRNQPEQFALRVYDEQFEEIWNKNIVMPYPDNQLTIEEYRVDDNGNVYLLGVLFKDGSGFRRQGRPNYEYVVLAYRNNGEKFDEYKVDIPGKFITDLTFRVMKTGDLVCAGFYSEKNSYSIKGTYYFRINTKTKEVYNSNSKEFDVKFLIGDLNSREVARANRKNESPELFQYNLDKLILRSDGGAVLVAEQFYVEERNEYDNRFNPVYGVYDRYNTFNNTNRIEYYYNYNDIIVVNIQPTGEIEWTARIPKNQETRNDGGYFSSYAMAVVRDKIYFVFNDNGRNYDGTGKSNRQYNFDGARSVIVAAEVKKGGEVTLFPLLKNSEAQVITRPKICKQIGRKEMAIFGENNGGFRFASLKFD